MMRINSTFGNTVLAGSLTLGENSIEEEGTIRYNAGTFEGYDGAEWSSFSGGGSSSRTEDGADQYSNNAGNVGVGTTMPQEKLHVSSGSILASGSSTSKAGIELQPQLGNSNSGGRVYFREDDNDFFGFSVGFNGGNSDRSFLNWRPNTFIIAAHSNDSIGVPAITITRGPVDIGIGTSFPTSKLDVEGDVRVRDLPVNNSLQNLVVADADGNLFSRDASTLTSGGSSLWSQNGADVYYNTGNVGIGTTNPNNRLSVFGPGDILSLVTTSTASGAKPFIVRSGNGSIEGMIVRCNGRVGMGTTNPAAKLHVIGDAYIDGKVWGREVEVTLASFPDYVFKADYDLMSLTEVDAFIQENGHLPNMPTEAEVVENGLNLGEMNVKLVEKVEELTHHLIEKEKQYEALQSRLELLESLIMNSENSKKMIGRNSKFSSKLKLLIVLVFSCSIQCVLSQAKCGTQFKNQEEIESYLERHKKYLQNKGEGKSTIYETKFIPVHWHFADSPWYIPWSPPYNEARAALARANNAFSETNIRFYECGISVIGSDGDWYSFDEVTEEGAMVNSHNIPGVLIVYVVDEIEAGGCGYANFPDTNPSKSNNGNNFVVMDVGCMDESGDTTLEHEFGHFFDIAHTHETVWGRN
ncbi:MAG: hypothetical protein ACJAQ4_002379 [Cryomorphaceae bacterium]|jgi:hypothetical protein